MYYQRNANIQHTDVISDHKDYTNHQAVSRTLDQKNQGTNIQVQHTRLTALFWDYPGEPVPER